jgi:hypothetical protein
MVRTKRRAIRYVQLVQQFRNNIIHVKEETKGNHLFLNICGTVPVNSTYGHAGLAVQCQWLSERTNATVHTVQHKQRYFTVT